ncbi:hypothetical protein ES703_109782 [subsurface metagenome]
MKVIRNHTALKRMAEEDDCFVNMLPQQRIAFIWELTAELWSLKGSQYAERRLQRNVTNLIKQQG